jgi:hypothetical protein
MNPYLSRDEKELMVRILALGSILEQGIETYANLRSTDKKFLAELRRAKAFLERAIKIRMDYLDATAQEKLVEATQKLQLIFVPTDVARKQFAELAKLKTSVPIDMADFQDWYEFLIEHACKTCRRQDYTECPGRRILMKYDVFPYDPGATERCQYSYAEDEVAKGFGTVGEALMRAMQGQVRTG